MFYKQFTDICENLEQFYHNMEDVEFTIDRERLLETLREIRRDERDGVEDVTALMERRE